MRRSFLSLVPLVVLSALSLFAQQGDVAPVASVVPHVLRYAGTLPDASAHAAVAKVRFAIYEQQVGGVALWTETQQVTLDSSGRYSVLLGGTSPVGLPDGLFLNGQARWVGVTLADGQEQARTALVAVSYALKAADAESLAGHPASDFSLKADRP